MRSKSVEAKTHDAMVLKSRKREAIARSAGVFAASLMIGVLAILVTASLALNNFAPLQPLEAIDDQLFLSLAPPPPLDERILHRVIFVDIDDGAVGGGHGRTSRPLLAKLISLLRAANPAVIFVDIDFRDELSGDGTLSAELQKPHQPPVLLPKYLDGKAFPVCSDQDHVPHTDRPWDEETAFDATSAGDSVLFVHVELESGALGLIEGFCSAYKLGSRPYEPPLPPDTNTEILGAMTAAVDIANNRAPGENDTPPHLIRSLWPIRNAKQPLVGKYGGPVYNWIPAKLLEWPGTDLGAFKSAIVILGATHGGSDDLHLTPVGPMAGALIHANFALDVQQPAFDLHGRRTAVLQLAFDALITVITCFLVTRYLWHPLHLKLYPGAELAFRQRAVRLVGEIAVWLAVFLIADLAVVWLFGPSWRLIPFWRFAFIGSMVGSICLFAFEGIFLIGEAAKACVEKVLSK